MRIPVLRPPWLCVRHISRSSYPSAPGAKDAQHLAGRGHSFKASNSRKILNASGNKHSDQDFFPGQASNIYSKSFSISDESTLTTQAHETKLLLSHIIRILDSMTPIQNAEENEQNSASNRGLKFPTLAARKFRANELPSQPEVWTRTSLVSHLSDLTLFYYPNTKRENPVAERVKYLLNPENEYTGSSLSTQAFNLGVRYFCGISDLEQARKLVDVMRRSGFRPDSETFHWFLYTLTRKKALETAVKRQIDKNANPALRVLKYLGEMKYMKLASDATTWNLVMQALPHGYAKSIIIEEMTRRKIQLDARSLSSCLEIITERYGLEPAMKHALNQGLAIEPGVLNLLVSKLLRQKPSQAADDAQLSPNLNVKRAFELSERVYATPKTVTRPQTRTLNIFLASFASRARVDWQFAMLNHYYNKHQILPNAQSVQELLEGAMRLWDCPEKYALIGFILQRYDVVLTPRAKVLHRRAIRNVEKSSKFSLTSPGSPLWEKLKTLEVRNWTSTNILKLIAPMLNQNLQNLESLPSPPPKSQPTISTQAKKLMSIRP